MDPLASRSAPSCQNPPALRFTTDPVCGRSGYVRSFQMTMRVSIKAVGMVCFVVLQPFAPHGFPRFFATMASADSSTTLIVEVSPGKVPRLSARIARLYRVRLSVTVGFRVP